MPSTVERTTLSVKDFGPIAQAEIDLRPFTVFVGASNTGKSYLAILLYALHQFFGRSVDPVRQFSLRQQLELFPDERVPRKHAKVIDRWLRDTQDEAPSRRGAGVALPEELAALVRPVLQNAGELAPLLDAEVKRCFGLAESTDLIRQPSGKCARIVLRREFGGNDIGQTGYDFSVSRKQSKLSSSIPTDLPLRIPEVNRRHLQWLDRAFVRLHAASYAVELADMTVPLIAGAVVRPVHYLPADRAGVMHAHRVVVSSLIGRASRAGLDEESPLPTLSGVLADFLDRLIGLADERKATGSARLAGRLETDILRGAVQVRRSAVGYPWFAYRPANWERELALMNTSSMVSELAPVVLYLRHVVRKGDVIIIEEPESHLHPQMQVAFTRFLATVVKAGIRVIITTHSEWVLEALANLVRLSEVPKSRRSKVNAAGPALKPDEVGAWHFEPKLRPKGSVVKEIPLDTVRGTFPAGFGDITEHLYNDWATIANLVGSRA